jgi:hypothetical protein
MHAGQTDRAGVPFERTVDERGRHTGDVAGGLGVGKRLVGRGLLQAVGICHGALAGRGGGVAQETEDPDDSQSDVEHQLQEDADVAWRRDLRVDDALRVVHVEEGAQGGEELLVRVLCSRQGKILSDF